MNKHVPYDELLFSLFAKEIHRVSVLTWDDVFGLREQGIASLEIGHKSVYVIAFTDIQRDPLDRCLLIMLGAGLRAVECGYTEAEIRQHAYPVLVGDGHDDEVTYCLQNLKFLLVPFDSMANYPICTKQLSLVSHEGELEAILIWLQHGVRLGFVYGYCDEMCFLINEQVDMVYNQAVLKRESKNLVIETKTFERPAHFRESQVDLISEFDWFNF